MNKGFFSKSEITKQHIPRTPRCGLCGWCDKVYVFMQDGWKESVGLNAEIKIAKELGKPIIYI